MSEYIHVEKPFLDQLAALGWEVIDQGCGHIPTDPGASLRTSFREVMLFHLEEEGYEVEAARDGREALRIGLVDHIVLEENFFSHLDEIAGNYLAACSVGTRLSKLVTNQAFDMDYETLLQYYFELQQRAQFSPDAQEAKRAYLEKREPKWQ